MYFFIQRVSEFKIRDLLFSRYSNVIELLETFNSFEDLKEYLFSLLDKSMDEEIYEFYLHKSVLSDMSYLDFKNKVMESSRPAISDKEQQQAVEFAKQFISEKEVE